MKKLSVLFSIFAVLMAVTFTSCDQSSKMEPLTEDMIGEWMIGTWKMEWSFQVSSSGLSYYDEITIESLENDEALETIKKLLFMKNKVEGANYSILVNKARTRIELSYYEKDESSVTEAENSYIIIMTKQ